MVTKSKEWELVLVCMIVKGCFIELHSVYLASRPAEGGGGGLMIEKGGLF